ncbi:MAG: hypothetical protein ABI947_24020 [Chloroflexota bacterium]
MLVANYDLDRDLRTAKEMAAGLTPYIYEDELYGLMPGDLPKLTVGGLMMRLHRLTAISGELSPAQQEVLRTAQEKLDAVRRDWMVAYEGKLQREFSARITSISQFLSECSDSPHNCADGYPSTAEKRAIAEALNDEALRLNIMVSDVKGALLSIDNKLHRYTHEGDFIWDARLKPAYPPEKYWFLYVKF